MPMTVLQIIPALGTGGAEQACVDIAAGLVARGDRALVVSSGGRRVREVEESGARHILRNVNTKNPLKIIRNAFWLADYIREEKIDVVHARSRAPAWSAYIACRLTGCRFVTTFHAAYKFSNGVKKAYNCVMAKADRIIAISPFIAGHVRENYHVPEYRLRTINRGISISQFDPEQVDEARKAAFCRSAGIEPDEKVILLPGRLSPIKGQAMFIRAMGHLRRRMPDMPKAILVGDDQGREAYTHTLLDMIQRRRLEYKVRLAGASADMPAAYSCALLVVVPSQVPEGFGRVPVEAMAMGLPVIASRLGATVDTVLEGRTGWLLPHDRPDEWAAAMLKALTLPQETKDSMARYARAHVAEHFDAQVMIAQTLAVYDELLAEKGA